MREHLECAFLYDPQYHQDPLAGDGAQSVATRRVVWTAVELEADAGCGMSPDPLFLQRMSQALLRFDACVLAVAPVTLGWARTALAAARGSLRTPVFVYARELRFAALQDLFELGAIDFIREPFCIDELRMRWQRQRHDIQGMTVGRRKPMDVATGEALSTEGGVLAMPVHEPTVHYGAKDLQFAAPGMLRPRPGFAMHARGPASMAAHRPRVSDRDIDATLRALSQMPHVRDEEPFRQAKSRVVAQFEQDYLKLALSRHGGNVARAARASEKHRRAFWALMRKHGIDAAMYRRDAYEGSGSTRVARTLSSSQ